MKSFRNIKIVILALTLLTFIGCTGSTSGACKYEQVFGTAKINKIEKQVAFVSFTLQDENGKASGAPQPLSLPAPWGIKAGEEYPALLHLFRSGPASCEKQKLIIIQEIGSSCKVK
jgi:hypothetical protein